MSMIQNLIDRQLGIYCRFNYDNILKRLVVESEESYSYYGQQEGGAVATFDQDPPIFACRFAEAAGYEHVLALANEDGRVAIQNTSSEQTARHLESFPCHNNAVFDLAWMPGNMNFVTASGDHTACLWDAAGGAPRRVLVFSHHTRSVKCAAFRPQEPSAFATGARDGHVLVWDVRASAGPALVLKPDNCLLNCHSSFTSAGGGGGGGRAGTPGSHGKRPRLERRATSITGLVFQDDVTLLSCGECDGNIKAWDLRKNYNIYTREPLPKHSIPYCGSSAKCGYSNLIVDQARVRLYASCMDDVIYCFNVSAYGATPERRYTGHENTSFYIKTSLSPDCMYLVSGSSDKHAYIWNLDRSEPLLRLSGHWAEVTCAAWGPRPGAKIVTCSDDARHKIWRIGRELVGADARELRGRAEPAPCPVAAPPPAWGAAENTPRSLKRRASTPVSGGAKRARDPATPASKTKRCLADLMNATRDTEEAETMVKRMRLDGRLPTLEEETLVPAGTKRRLAASPTRVAPAWTYQCPGVGSSFMSPTKKYEPRNCKVLSPHLKVSTGYRSPETPPKVRLITFGTPTKDLPDFVMSGEAPHLRLMSPPRKKPDTTDWLTRIARDRRAPAPLSSPAAEGPPASPKGNIPTRRNSATDRTPKSNKKTRTLLKYFNVATRARGK